MYSNNFNKKKQAGHFLNITEHFFSLKAAAKFTKIIFNLFMLL